MNNDNSLNIVLEDLFNLIISLIADDLKVQKHFHNLNLSGLDTASLQLNLHYGIFRLSGFKKNDITEEFKQWYFHQTERVFNIDIANDEKAFQDLATEILDGLINLRNEMYKKRFKKS